jgi:hypothetical protein
MNGLKVTPPQRLASQDINHVVTVDYETKPNVYGDDQNPDTITLTEHSSKKLLDPRGKSANKKKEHFETFSAKVVLQEKDFSTIQGQPRAKSSIGRRDVSKVSAMDSEWGEEHPHALEMLQRKLQSRKLTFNVNALENRIQLLRR